MATAVLIRAHHILCLQGFQGHGYNQAFVQNMTDVITALKINPKTRIQLTKSLDAFCKSCPHQGLTSCDKDDTSELRMAARDQAVLDLLKIQDGAQMSFEEAMSKTRQKIESQKDLIVCCGQCEWKKNCGYYNNQPSCPGVLPQELFH